ncbi:MAG: hypothetical protein SGPRY_011178, partial [Prymnesium sp.]
MSAAALSSREGCTVAPEQTQLVEKELAAVILGRITSSREGVPAREGGRRRHNLAPTARAARPSASRGALRIMQTSKLEEIQRQGIYKPNSDGSRRRLARATWQGYELRPSALVYAARSADAAGLADCIRDLFDDKTLHSQGSKKSLHSPPGPVSTLAASRDSPTSVQLPQQSKPAGTPPSIAPAASGGSSLGATAATWTISALPERRGAGGKEMEKAVERGARQGASRRGKHVEDSKPETAIGKGNQRGPGGDGLRCADQLTRPRHDDTQPLSGDGLADVRVSTLPLLRALRTRIAVSERHRASVATPPLSPAERAATDRLVQDSSTRAARSAADHARVLEARGSANGKTLLQEDTK